MLIDDIKKFVNILKSHPTKQIITEASGGIDFSNLKSYATTGVDVISMGCLTDSRIFQMPGWRKGSPP